MIDIIFKALDFGSIPPPANCSVLKEIVSTESYFFAVFVLLSAYISL